MENIKMKYLAIYFMVGLAAIALISAEEEEEMRAEYCKDVPKGCFRQACNKDNTRISRVPCGTSKCRNGAIGVKHNPDLPYPGCCRRLICKNTNAANNDSKALNKDIQEK